MKFNTKYLLLHFVDQIISNMKEYCAASTAFASWRENFLYESQKFDFRDLATLSGCKKLPEKLKEAKFWNSLR